MSVVDRRPFGAGKPLKDITTGSVIDISDWDDEISYEEDRFAIVVDVENMGERPIDTLGCLPVVTFGGNVRWPAELERFIVVEAQTVIVGNKP